MDQTNNNASFGGIINDIINVLDKSNKKANLMKDDDYVINYRNALNSPVIGETIKDYDPRSRQKE